MNTDDEIPVWETAFASWRYLLENAGAALPAAALPFLLILALNRIGVWLDPHGMAALAWGFAYTVLFAVPATLLLVPWYRRVLSAAQSGPSGRPAAWWSAVFLARTLALELLLFTALLPAQAVFVRIEEAGGEPDPAQFSTVLILFLALLPGLYFYARSAMALPAAASEGDHRYARSWRLTASSGWGIVGVLLLCAVPVFLVSLGLAEPASDAASPPPPSFLKSALSAALSVTGELVSATALAHVYLHLGGGMTEDEE